MEKLAADAKETLLSGNGAGNDFLGWVNLPVDYDKEEFGAIKEAAKKIQANSEVLVVIGIGGSYLGARALLNLLHILSIISCKRSQKAPEIYFAGNNISSKYLQNLIDIIADRIFQ